MPIEESVSALTFATLIMVAGFGRGLIWGFQKAKNASSLVFLVKASPQEEGHDRRVQWLDLAFYLAACVVTLMTVGILLPLVSIIVGCWILHKREFHVPELWGFRLKEWGWYFWRGADIYLLTIIPLSICAASSVFLYNLLGLEVAPQPLILDFLEMENRSQIIQIILLAVVVAPVWEELVFRGILYPLCRGLQGPVFAMLSTAVLFGLVHGHGPSFFPLSFLGLILAYTFEKTGKLGLCIGLHAAFNASTTITLLLIKYGS